MKRSLFGNYGTLIALIASATLAGCSAEVGTQQASNGPAPAAEKQAETGTLSMSLESVGTRGTVYRLRNADFEVTPYYYNYDTDAGSPLPQVVSSDTEPTASSIDLSLEKGNYYVSLRPGWQIEEVAADGTSTPVEAQLLSDTYQYLYVYPHSTSWVKYQFGIGSRKIWFNGEAQIAIEVYEKPSDYYGGNVDAGTSGTVPLPSVPSVFF